MSDEDDEWRAFVEGHEAAVFGEPQPVQPPAVISPPSIPVPPYLSPTRVPLIDLVAAWVIPVALVLLVVVRRW
jgi:hypothetical protein